MKHRLLVLALTCSLVSCVGLGAVLPFVSPLLEKMLEYVVGETPEEEFLKDVIESVVEGDPLQILWSITEPPISKYLLGTESTSVTIDSTGSFTRELVQEPKVSVTFLNNILVEFEDVDPDTIIGDIPDPPGPEIDPYVACLAGCLELPPGKIKRCVDDCNRGE